MTAMNIRHRVAIAILAVLAAQPLALQAQNRELQAQLMSATRIDCSFSSIAKGDWSEESTTFSTEPSDFTAAFFDIDVDSGTAEAEGRFGASYIIVRYAQGYLHFMQTLNSGPLYLTTVLAEPTGNGRLKAVHTRHEYTEVSLPGFTSRPEMYIGDCAVTVAEPEESD
jgi:hypothetical protein